ncbi:hypothetical protein BDV96DRAFT_81250 [Lophiotrema nucula]|uniref:Uncharacterized protein n=1 Tax=Lophiotrema nucula TaxID=690887 RepID=A0A6A5Z7U1_9PLEO|nr:hypothetical protein BDV96DRAFT_81250 [Lophiotrema nucula]
MDMGPENASYPSVGYGTVTETVSHPANAATLPSSKSQPTLATASKLVSADGFVPTSDENAAQRRDIIVKNPVIRVKQLTEENSSTNSSRSAISKSTRHDTLQAGRAGAHPSAENAGEDTNISDIVDEDRVEVDNEYDRKAFYKLATSSTFDLASIHYLVIHLNASQHDELTDDFLAIALNQLHPTADGTNPHDLCKLTIVLHGNTLFTRHNYTLVSPAASGEIIGNLNKLMTGGLKRKEKEKLAYAVNVTEKAAVKALLGIRGVQEVFVEGVGRAKMDSGLQEMIVSSLICPPNAQLGAVPDPGLEKVLAREGVVTSTEGKVTYKLRDYNKVRPSWKEHSPTKPVLIDEYSATIMRAAGIDEDEVLKNATRLTRSSRRKIYDVTKDLFYTPPSPPPSPRAHHRRGPRSIFPGLASSDHSTDTDEDEIGPFLDGRTLSEMVRIMTRQQDNDDLMTSKKTVTYREIDQQLPNGLSTKHGEWFVLTGKGNNVQLGWRV